MKLTAQVIGSLMELVCSHGHMRPQLGMRAQAGVRKICFLYNCHRQATEMPCNSISGHCHADDRWQANGLRKQAMQDRLSVLAVQQAHSIRKIYKQCGM